MALKLHTRILRWELREPFQISRDVMVDVPVAQLTLIDSDGYRGRAEAAGVDYAGETPRSMVAQLDAVASRVNAERDSSELDTLLPPGGARNLLDCALADLRAKRDTIPVWKSLGLALPQAVTTAITIGIGDVELTRRRAASLRSTPLIKVKVNGTNPIETVRIVREEAPDARIIVDANEGWSLAFLDQCLSDFQDAGVELIEQPLARGADHLLTDFRSPIPLAADESCTDRSSLDALQGRYHAINIKLDKCGGLTEGLALARAARARGFEVLVGNMCGSSLAMAPAFLLTQLARWVDLDGPLLQREDCDHALEYRGGWVQPPQPALWG